MPSTTVTITGATRSALLSRLGYGMMNLTWKNKQTPDKQAFEAIEAAIIPGDQQTQLNSAEFYGRPDLHSNLKLLNRFYSTPLGESLISNTFLAVKGGLDVPGGFRADSSPEYLKKSTDTINELLRGEYKEADVGKTWKKMDMFQPARVDKTRPIEETMRSLKKLVEEGKFDFAGLSEVSAETIRRAHQVYPVSAVEVEYSPWSLDIEKNGVLETCRELKIVIFAYSPLGRGMLTGTIRSPDDIPEGDGRKHYDRFQPENFHHNLKLVDAIGELAKKKECTPSQLCLSWLMHQDDLIVPIPGSTRPEGVKESVAAINITLTPEEEKEIRDLCEKADIRGGRYNDQVKHTLAV